jgi:hypothetical protein
MNLGFIFLTFEPVNDIFIKHLELLSKIKNSKIAVHHDYYKCEFPDKIIKRFNLSIVNPYYKTYWSHVNNVKAMIDGFKMLYTQPNPPDWYITLTPSCFPIKSIDKIESFYNEANKNNIDAFIDMHEVGNTPDMKMLDKTLLRDMYMQPWFKIPFISKKGKFYLRQIRKNLNVNNNPFVGGKYIYWQGSNHLSINKKIVEKIIDSKSSINELISFYETNIVETPDMHPCPQETIIQTFIANQENINIMYNNYRYIDWNNPEKEWSPKVLTEKDYIFLKDSDALWARKLLSPQSDSLITKIENTLIN